LASMAVNAAKRADKSAKYFHMNVKL